jgi:Holliday junction DNA helicase RuvB
VGATTRIGLLTAPLRDRFGVVHQLQPYLIEELVVILTRSARLLGVEMTEEGAAEMARRARGNPRIANRLLKRVRDFAQVRFDGVITLEVAVDSLNRLDIDPLGLDGVDIKMLSAIIKKFDGGPVGIETLAASLDEEVGTLEEVAEPYLMQLGFIQRTPRGRTVTRLGYAHLRIPFPEPPPPVSGQLDLFGDN